MRGGGGGEGILVFCLIRTVFFGQTDRQTDRQTVIVVLKEVTLPKTSIYFKL